MTEEEVRLYYPVLLKKPSGGQCIDVESMQGFPSRPKMENTILLNGHLLESDGYADVYIINSPFGAHHAVEYIPMYLYTQ